MNLLQIRNLDRYTMVSKRFIISLAISMCITACGRAPVDRSEALPATSLIHPQTSEPVNFLLSQSLYPGLGHQALEDEDEVDCKSPTRYYSLLGLSIDSAKKDAALAFDRGDRRFLAVNGYGRSMPGTDAFVSSGAEYYGYRVIQGTTDMACDVVHMGLIGNARAYAEIYNEEIIRLLKLQ